MNIRRTLLPILFAALLVGAMPASQSFARPHGNPQGYMGGDCGDCPGWGYHMGKGYGQGNGYGPGQGYGHGCEPCMGYGPGMRDMTPELREKHAAIIDEYAGKMDALEDQIFVMKQTLRAMQNADNPDVEKVRAQATELRALQRQMRDLHREMAQKLASDVNPAAGKMNKGPAGAPKASGNK